MHFPIILGFNHPSSLPLRRPPGPWPPSSAPPRGAPRSPATGPSRPSVHRSPPGHADARATRGVRVGSRQEGRYMCSSVVADPNLMAWTCIGTDWKTMFSYDATQSVVSRFPWHVFPECTRS